MNYELALELKKAGFPQGKRLVIPKGSGFVDPEGNLNLPIEPVYLPTLKELMDGCGNRFGYLERDENGGDWTACDSMVWKESGNNPDVDKIIHTMGSTPLEAVANLWLELNNGRNSNI